MTFFFVITFVIQHGSTSNKAYFHLLVSSTAHAKFHRQTGSRFRVFEAELVFYIYR